MRKTTPAMFQGCGVVPTVFGKYHSSSILFGDTMVLIIESDSILLLGYSILYKEYNLTASTTKRTLLI